MNPYVIGYVKEHKRGYISDLSKAIGELEVKNLELMGFIERGQELISIDKRVESYKTTDEFDDYYSLIFPVEKPRNFIQKIFDRDTARLIAKNIKRG